MVDRHLLRECEPAEAQLEQELACFGKEDLDNSLLAREPDLRVNRILKGRVVRLGNSVVHIDIGFKSPGAVPLGEWFNEVTGRVVAPQVGDEVEVLLTQIDDSGTPALSHRRARHHSNWTAFVASHKEGDTVSGTVTARVPGGLLVNIGISAFLPASQVDIRRPSNVSDYIGRTIECKILCIDSVRQNVILSRRALIADSYPMTRKRLLADFAPGQLRQGVVKNIAEFGAFVDLGGIDALLHVSDMAWRRVTNPHDVVQLEQTLEVVILQVDQEKEKIAVGLKQKTPNPWEEIASKYPVGSRHTLEVIRIESYGVFVRLEQDLEGLVHIAEMSWTRRINHPSERVSVGDRIEVLVVQIDKDRGLVALSMRQLQADPWLGLTERLSVGAVLCGVARCLTSYGVFVEIEEGIDGLLHVTDLSRIRKVAHPSEIVSKGDWLLCSVLHIDRERRRIMLGLRQTAVASAWRTAAVTAIAEVIDSESRLEDLPILADALEDAGCADVDLLGYLRGRGPHLRECWAIGLLEGEAPEGQILR